MKAPGFLKKSSAYPAIERTLLSVSLCISYACYVSLQQSLLKYVNLGCDGIPPAFPNCTIRYGRAMLRKRSYSVVVSVFGVVGMLLAGAVFAADLTIPSGPRASPPRTLPHASGKQQKEGRVALRSPREAQLDHGKLLIVPVATAKLPPKGKRKIKTYNLFHDPVFKLAGAVTSRSPLGPRPGEKAPAIAGLGSGYTFSGPASMPAGMTLGSAIKSTPGEVRPPALKMESTETSGLEFACREKAFTPNYIRRDMSACYQSNLDKSWRTRTFVSQGMTDGGREWGGGLSVIYAH